MIFMYNSMLEHSYMLARSSAITKISAE